MSKMRPVVFLLTFSGVVASSISAVALSAPYLSGAIFTTTVDGDVVNENVHYDAKTDVYLDGGPGPNAPSSAAGLPEGDYYFQVTDPSGKDLLSTDHISCREVHVTADGVIDEIYAGTNYKKVAGTWTGVTCQHEEGVDADYGDIGAITAQLYPYDDTPNAGGVYKVWLTPVDDYTGSAAACSGKGSCNVNGENYTAGDYHGFVPAYSKTDNFKVKKSGKPFTAPTITVSKFHDKNFDGVQDEDEETVTGWPVTMTDTLGIDATLYTTDIVVTAEAGTYSFEEDVPEGVMQTVALLDSLEESWYPTADPIVDVVVSGTSGETHTVEYGNVGLGSVTACKVLDFNYNGQLDAFTDADGRLDGPDESYVVGWEFTIEGDLANGESFGPETLVSGASGDSDCAVADGLLPGTYTIEESFPDSGDWVATGDTSYVVDIVSTLDGSEISGTDWVLDFTNIRFETADFGTKGFWHNKNGLEILQEDGEAGDCPWVEEVVNELSIYATPSSYFGDGDEYFDGLFADGTYVEAVSGEAGEVLAPEGTCLAEVSRFLVDANADGDPCEQLAQQFLALIFNAHYYVENPNAVIQFSETELYTFNELLDYADAKWDSECSTSSSGGLGLVITDFTKKTTSLNESSTATFGSSSSGTLSFP